MASSLLILLVDDDELSLELIALVLSAEGHRVSSVATGAEALQRVATISPSQWPDVVLTDMQMPDMHGEELGRRLRQHFDQHPAPRPMLIGMSASRPSEEQVHAFDGFVSKPLDPLELQDLIRRWSGGPSAAAVFTSLSGTSLSGSPGPVAQSSAAALDTVVLEKLRRLMPGGALDELFSSYLADTRVRLAEMEQFAVAGDQAAVRRSAHMMKGSAAMTGATGMSRIAAVLETGNLPLDEQRVLFRELHCACDAIEGTLARDARRTEAHDHQTF